jgi:hypothetical protein
VREVTRFFLLEEIKGPFYSYGDSSGIKPDSHFNPAFNAGTNYAANVKANDLKFKK